MSVIYQSKAIEKVTSSTRSLTLTRNKNMLKILGQCPAGITRRICTGSKCGLGTVLQFDNFICMPNKYPIYIYCSFPLSTLRCNKVGRPVLAHPYPHKLSTKIKVVTCNSQADDLLHVWPGVSSGDLRAERI